MHQHPIWPKKSQTVFLHNCIFGESVATSISPRARVCLLQGETQKPRLDASHPGTADTDEKFLLFRLLFSLLPFCEKNVPFFLPSLSFPADCALPCYNTPLTLQRFSSQTFLFFCLTLPHNFPGKEQKNIAFLPFSHMNQNGSCYNVPHNNKKRHFPKLFCSWVHTTLALSTISSPSLFRLSCPKFLPLPFPTPTRAFPNKLSPSFPLLQIFWMGRHPARSIVGRRSVVHLSRGAGF